MRVDKYRDHQKYVDFIESYASATNAATGSKVDSNANVEHKTISTVQTEVPKADNIKTNRLLMWKQLAADYGEPIAERYLEDIETHLIYKHDETSFSSYCASVTLYPFLLNGTKGLGGCSEPPKHLQSFVGGFINLIYALSSQLAGAVATPELLPYFDYFCRKDYGEDYRFKVNEKADMTGRTLGEVLDDYFQQIVYSINQPAGARGYQSVFWNVAYFDRPYFEGLFQDFCFPDGTEMNWDSVSWLQKRFMKWFNAERLKSASLTFPVESLSLLDNGKEYVDKEWADFAAEMWAEGHSFFLYRSDNVDSLSSCCRLRNEIQDNQFSYTLGAGGISTGSKAVMTINFNRLVQTIHNNGQIPSVEEVIAATNSVVARVHLYLSSFNKIITHRIEQGLLPIYDSGFINPDRQYLTVGIQALTEAAEFMGYTIKPDDARYCDFVNAILKCINDRNKADKAPGVMFNTECVPAESLGVRNAKWDKEDGLKANRNCYNSYFYLSEDPTTNALDKLRLHGGMFTRYLDGGSAAHIGLAEHLSKEQYRKLMDVMIKEGTPYATFNIPNTVCNNCGHISKRMLKACPECGSKNLDYLTRIIGYLKRISSFSVPRQQEAAVRYYEKVNNNE